MRSFKAQTSAFMFFSVLLAAPFARADKKDDQYAKGVKAATVDADSIAARDIFCALAKEDPEYKDVKAQCADYTAAANRTLNRYKIAFGDGTAAMDSGDYATAETKFRSIKAGDYADSAKKKLAEIAKLKQDKVSADAAETEMKKKLDAGNNAFAQGDFASAKASLSAISGSHQGDAQATLKKISDYEIKLREATTLRDAHSYAAAATAYTALIQMNPNGPGNPATELAAANRLKDAPIAAPVNTTPTVTASNPIVAVKKPEPKLIDVNKFNQEGRKAMAKGDFKKAKRFFQEILAQDVKNQEANDAIAELNQKDTSKTQASDADPQLSRYVSLFYDGSYLEVEPLLNTYIFSQTNGKGKLGLANFYAGASMLTRYYLGGAVDENLRREARKKFKAAKEVEGFKAPDKYVSPKIMKVFETS
ncbi:MAG: hypothetical protein JWO13_2308 [Acidobacteriales bacterium]|nr:hypothetical protein [Terriglobales bacterium]